MAKPTKEKLNSPEVERLRASLKEHGIVLSDPSHPLKDYPPYHLRQVIGSAIHTKQDSDAIQFVRGDYTERAAREWLRDSRIASEFQIARIVTALASRFEEKNKKHAPIGYNGWHDYAVDTVFGMNATDKTKVRQFLLISAIANMDERSLDALCHIVAAMEYDGWGCERECIQDCLKDGSRASVCDILERSRWYDPHLKGKLMMLTLWADLHICKKSSERGRNWAHAAKKGELPWEVKSFDELEERGFDVEKWRAGGYAVEFTGEDV